MVTLFLLEIITILLVRAPRYTFRYLKHNKK
nr:MAG TPA: hypothetical protein [Caudoviricetes sp.]